MTTELVRVGKTSGSVFLGCAVFLLAFEGTLRLMSLGGMEWSRDRLMTAHVLVSLVVLVAICSLIALAIEWLFALAQWLLKRRPPRTRRHAGAKDEAN